jgi:hypothetical protein
MDKRRHKRGRESPNYADCCAIEARRNSLKLKENFRVEAGYSE